MSPQSPSADFITEKNAETNKPIFLYRVQIAADPDADGAEDDLYLAEYDEDVEFFKDENTAQTYTKFPITHESVSENTGLVVDTVQVSVMNVSREIQAYLEANDGLIGRKVTIRQVFADYLTDPDAYIEDIFFIDSVPSYDEKVINFTLTSKFDLLKLTLPRRYYRRDFCQWKYKDQGCWLDDGDGTFSWPTPFSADTTWLWGTERTGVSDPGDLVNYTAQATTKFVSVNLKMLTKANASLKIDLKCDVPARLTSTGQIEITSSGTCDDEEWYYTNPAGLTITDTYQTFTIPLSSFVNEGGGLDVTAINYIRWWNYATDTVNLYWKNAKIYWTTSGTFPDECRKTLVECRRHNNQARFGAFPAVPNRRVFRG